jgi:hypothetical protein
MFILIFILTLLLVGCWKTDEEKVFREQSVQDIESALQYFDVQYEDLVYEDEELDAEYIGTVQFIRHSKETIDLMIYEDETETMTQVTVYLNEETTTRQVMYIEQIDIIFMDRRNEVYVELSLYNSGWITSLTNMKLERNIMDFRRGLSSFKTSHVRQILYDYGYREVIPE